MILLTFILNLLFVTTPEDKTLHDFKIKKLDSEEVIDFSQFAGKKILIVNVASKCGYTPQYEDLQQLYAAYKDQLVIVGFPCNQFGKQESGTESSIAEFCSSTYGVDFPMTTKIDVKGDGQHPIYQWLTQKSQNGVDDYSVKWNFNKFLIDENGKLLEYFPSKVKPYDQEILKYFN
jgi:glutathione peroxidase